MIGLRSQAIRTVLRWQVMATTALAVISVLVAGQHGGLSAALGGLVSLVAGLGFAAVASVSRKDSAGLAMLAALRAEAVKILLIVLLLWVVLATYKNIVIVAFIGTFIVATIVFALALFVREK
ncbi:MAG: ATP synthase subunit I [Gammaproteobacteria bacterium]|nr:ATP synthase subunit I [Gammaproteobacteria bacterium]